MNIRTTTSSFAIVAATLGTLMLPSNAFGQTTQEPSAASAADEDRADQSGIAEIIVTASRREQTLQKTAIPVTAITGETLTALGVANVQELTKLAPTLKIGQGGGGALLITTRGVGNLGANNANEPGVAFNYGGAYLARSFGGNGIFYDIARVELLKGPQGTLYGRNATGGVLNIITNDPTDEFGGNITVESGNYSLLRASGAINLPITEGVALRLSGQAIDRDGYLSDGYSDEKAYSGRAKLLLEPSDGLSILLEANFAVNKGKGVGSVIMPLLDPSNPYTGPSDSGAAGVNSFFSPAPIAYAGASPTNTFIGTNTPPPANDFIRIGDDGFQDNRSRQFIGTLNYDLGGVKATLVAANTRNTQKIRQYVPGFQVNEDTTQTPNKYTTAELRLASDNDSALKWVLGAFYYNEHFFANPFTNQGISFSDSRRLDFHNKSYSGFGEATFSVTPSVRLTAGGRYTSDVKSISGSTFTRPNAPLFLTCPVGQTFVAAPPRFSVTPAAPSPNTCRSDAVGKETFNKFTYKLGAEADLGEKSLVYATYSTGFKSGGFFSAPTNNTFRPENITAYTLGSKNRFLDNTLQINLEGFLWKYKDKQVSHLGLVPPTSQILVVDNVGDATLYGAELDVVWQPTQADNLSLNVQYMHSKYDSYSFNQLVPNATPTSTPATGCAFTPVIPAPGGGFAPGRPGLSTINCTGNRLSLAPTWSAGASYQHTFELPGGSTLVPSISTRIESSYFVGEEYFAGQLQKSYMMSDASLTWSTEAKDFSLTGFINNIENEAVAQTSSLNGTLRKAFNTLRPPRTYGIRASVKF